MELTIILMAIFVGGIALIGSYGSNEPHKKHKKNLVKQGNYR